MKYSEFVSSLKNALIGASRVWIEIPSNSSNIYRRVHLNVFTGVIITVSMNDKGEVLQIK